MSPQRYVTSQPKSPDVLFLEDEAQRLAVRIKSLESALLPFANVWNSPEKTCPLDKHYQAASEAIEASIVQCRKRKDKTGRRDG